MMFHQAEKRKSWCKSTKTATAIAAMVLLSKFNASLCFVRSSTTPNHRIVPLSATARGEKLHRTREKSILCTRPTKYDHDEIKTSSLDRRIFLRNFVATSTAVASGVASFSLEAVATAAPSRQLEFCLVSVARAVYWATLAAQNLQQLENDPSLAKAAYLEARLGAKAMLTGKIGGGANAKVYMLSTLQIPGSLQDLQTYYSQGGGSSSSSSTIFSFSDSKSDWYEAVAAMVEFDGLDTLTDPSPRSSLTLQQYDPSKAVFIRRILTEKVIPVGQKLLQAFPDDARQRAKDYIERTYPSEVIGESIL